MIKVGYELSRFSKQDYQLCPAVYRTLERVDALLNRLGMARLGYRIALECRIES